MRMELIQHIKNRTSAVSDSKFKTEVYSEKNANHNCSKLIEVAEILRTPEALVRLKHEFPITITKHKTRLRRRRPSRKPVQQLKNKYGFSTSSYQEPLHGKNLHGNHKSVLTTFGSKRKLRNYAGFYKELDPDFTFEDITFSEYEGQPTILNVYDKNKTNKKQSKNRSKKIKSLNKFNQEKSKIIQNWKDSSIKLEQPIEALLHEEPPWHKASDYIKTFQKPFENQLTKKDLHSQQQYKEKNQKFYVPHSKYGVPKSEYNEEYASSNKKNRFEFGELFQINIPNTHNKKRIQIPKNLNRLNHNVDSKKTPLQETANVGIITKPPLYVQPPDKNYNGYFGETSFPNYQKELPLQSDTTLNFNFPKSSYDVPVYDYMPFKLNEEAHANYPPLTDYHLIPEPKHSPSKIALPYAVSNYTLIPLGYFNDNRQNFSTLLLSHVSNQKYLNQKKRGGDIKKNITMERKFTNRNSNKMSFDNVTNAEDTLQLNYHKVIKQKSEEIDSKNDEKIYPTRSNRVRTHIPKDLFLLSLANKKPTNHTLSLSWDPMKVTSYNFKIDHNISASKTDNKSHELIIMTASNYKRSEKKIKKNENLNSFSTRISKSHNSAKLNYQNLNFAKTSENLNEGNQFNVNYNNFDKVNNTAKMEKEHKDSPNLTLIQEPFDFNEKKNSEKRQFRYKNHRYN